MVVTASSGSRWNLLLRASLVRKSATDSQSVRLCNKRGERKERTLLRLLIDKRLLNRKLCFLSASNVTVLGASNYQTLGVKKLFLSSGMFRKAVAKLL